jgi:hypothetical protein
MRIKVSVMTIILLLITMSLCGCYIERDVTDYSGAGYEECYYELSLSSDTEVVILWPVPIVNSTYSFSGEEILSKIVDDIELINGSGTYIIDKNKDNYVINITFSNSIEIKAKKKINDEYPDEQTAYIFDDLSMKNINEEHQYHVYSSGINVTMNKFSCYMRAVRDSYNDTFIHVDIENIELDKGWQSLEFW